MNKKLTKSLVFVLVLAVALIALGTGVLADTEVAMIGETPYGSLAEAVAEAQDGDTIELIADCSSSETITINKVLTLDLKGFTFTSTATDGITVASGTLTVTDSSANGSGKISHTAASDDAVWVKSGGTLILEKGTIESDIIAIYNSGTLVVNGGTVTGDYAGAYNVRGTATVNDGTVSGDYGIVICGNGTASSATLTVNGGTISGTGDNYAISGNGTVNDSENNGGTVINITGGTVTSPGDAAIYQPQNGVLNISGGTITGKTGIYQKSGQLNITGGTINGTGDAVTYAPTGDGSKSTGDGVVIDNCGYPGGAPTASISGGTINSANAKAVASYASGENNQPIEKFISSGTFSSKPDEAYLAEGTMAVKNGDKWTVGQAADVAVAKIGDKYYASLAEAVAAVPADGTETTITILKDQTIEVIGYAITVASGKKVVLDLNGHEVVGACTESGTSALIRNLGTLTVNDSVGGGKLIGGADPTWTWDGSDDYSGSYASNLIRNEGTLTVNGGTLYNASSGSAAYAIDNYSAGQVTINGGTVDAKKASAIRLFYNNGGKIVVNDGTIGRYNSDDDRCYMGIQAQAGTDADVEVNGGTIAGQYALYTTASGNSSVDISGGTFYGYVGFGSASSNDISISGGQFNSWAGTWGSQTKFISGGTFALEPDEEYIADGYEALGTADGKYTVLPAGSAVAQIGTTKYASLAAAAAASEDGDTITLLKDAALPGGYTEFHEDVTLDLNGKAVTGGALDVYGKMTITDSSTDKNGSITGVRHGVWVNPGAKLTVAAGTISGGDGLNDEGKQDGSGIIVENAELVVTGGTVTCIPENTAIEVSGNSTATISGGTVTGGEWGVTVFGTSTLNVSDNAAISCAADDGYAISTNGNAGQNATINIEGGTISGGELGIYAPSGTWTISGGTISGATGVYFKSQKLTISGGTINGTGAAVDYNYNGNGGNPTGDGLVIDSCGYPNGISGVSITGGDFNSANAKPVACYTYEDNTPVTKFITGGTYNKEPEAEYVKTGYEAVQSGERWIIDEIDPEDAFTFVVVPTGTEKAGGLDPEIVDVKKGDGTVTFDIELHNDYATDLEVNTFKIVLDTLPTGLTCSANPFSASDLPGLYTFRTDSTNGGKYSCNYSTDDWNDPPTGLFTVPAGDSVVVARLTLNVDDAALADLAYGTQLKVKLVETAGKDPNIHTELVDDALYPGCEEGVVEVATTYEIKYDLDGDPATTDDQQVQTVGVNVDPTTEDDYPFAGDNAPTNPGFTFLGWTTDPDAMFTATTSEMGPATADVIYYPIWGFNGDIVFYNYKYAVKLNGNEGGKLILVGLSDVAAGKAVTLGGNAMFTTTDENYLAILNAAYAAGNNSGSSVKDETNYTVAYIYIVPGGETVASVAAALSVADGSNIAITRNSDVTGNGNIDSGDWGVADDLLYARKGYSSIQWRLECDVDTSDGGMQFGSIKDIIKIIDASNGQ